MEASYATVKSMAEQIEADVILLRERQEAGGPLSRVIREQQKHNMYQTVGSLEGFR